MPVLEAFVFGFTLAVAVGPIALLIISQSAAHGFPVGFRCGLGAALADLTYALVAFTAGHLVAPFLSAHEAAVRWAAGGVLALFALAMVRSGWRSLRAPAGMAPARSPGAARALWTTYALTIVNPMTVLIFLGFAGGVAGRAGRPAGETVAMALAIFAGSAVVQTAFAAGGANLGRWLRRPGSLGRLNVLAGLGILGFALLGLWRAWKGA
jgi:threonine/homoserine/homoserine lactone efflux protein